LILKTRFYDFIPLSAFTCEISNNIIEGNGRVWQFEEKLHLHWLFVKSWLALLELGSQLPSFLGLVKKAS
jgi:hypothetical protein